MRSERRPCICAGAIGASGNERIYLMGKVVSAEDTTETAVDRMWKATSAFMHTLDAHPGWREFQKSRLRHAMDFDDVLPRQDSATEFFEFPVEIARQHDVVTLYLELLDNVFSVKSCEYYFRRYPFRGLPVSRHEHLSNVCEMFFGRFYQFKERLKKYSGAVAAASPENRLDFGTFINTFSKEFDQELRARNEIHHHRRFSDLSIEQIFISGALADRWPDKSWNVEHRATYRKTANEWALRAKNRGARLDAFMEAIADATLLSCSHFLLAP